MRDLVKDFVKICSETLPIAEPIIEFGSLQVPGQEGFADLRPLFPSKEFIGADIREGPGVDMILDLHDTDLPSESVGTILIIDTLEHVEFCRKAMEESYRILRPEGILIMSSVMNFPIHDFPSDYWRFTPEGFKSLLKSFNSVFVTYAGDSLFPHTVVGIGFKSLITKKLLNLLDQKCNKWKEIYNDQWISLKRMNQLLVPPILRIMWRRMRETLLGK